MSGATDRYPHGILGDDVEAAEVTIADPRTGDVVTTIAAPEGFVFESVGVMWADVDGDGADDVLVTASNGEVGARLLAFTVDGEILASSEPIGRGGRWRHQVSAGPFGPDGEFEVVDVRTPHIGGIAEFFRVRGGTIDPVATAAGFGSHRIRTRNLDMATAFDVDGDGRPEVILPDQDRERLVAIGRVGDRVEEVWSFELGGELTSNLAAVTGPDGAVTMAAAVGGRLFVWP